MQLAFHLICKCPASSEGHVHIQRQRHCCYLQSQERQWGTCDRGKISITASWTAKSWLMSIISPSRFGRAVHGVSESAIWKVFYNFDFCLNSGGEHIVIVFLLDQYVKRRGGNREREKLEKGKKQIKKMENSQTLVLGMEIIVVWTQTGKGANGLVSFKDDVPCTHMLRKWCIFQTYLYNFFDFWQGLQNEKHLLYWNRQLEVDLLETAQHFLTSVRDSDIDCRNVRRL